MTLLAQSDGDQLVSKTEFSDPIRFRFERPRNWRVKSFTNDDQRTVEVTHRVGDRVTGRIVIQVCRTDISLQGLVSSYADTMKVAQVQLGGARLSRIVPPPGCSEAVSYFPTASFSGQDIDSPVFAFRRNDICVLLALAGPSRQQSAEWWEFNKKAFALVQKSLFIESK